MAVGEGSRIYKGGTTVHYIQVFCFHFIRLHLLICFYVSVEPVVNGCIFNLQCTNRRGGDRGGGSFQTLPLFKSTPIEIRGI